VRQPVEGVSGAGGVGACRESENRLLGVLMALTRFIPVFISLLVRQERRPKADAALQPPSAIPQSTPRYVLDTPSARVVAFSPSPHFGASTQNRLHRRLRPAHPIDRTASTDASTVQITVSFSFLFELSPRRPFGLWVARETGDRTEIVFVPPL
jgi:hypothetical protein